MEQVYNFAWLHSAVVFDFDFEGLTEEHSGDRFINNAIKLIIAIAVPQIVGIVSGLASDARNTRMVPDARQTSG